MNFVPTLTVNDPSQLVETVRGMVMRHGHRIWNLRLLQAEVKMTLK